MTGRTSLLLLLGVALCACRGHDAREVSGARGVAARPALAHASQDDLARELDDADRHGTWNTVRARWEGQHVHWKVTRYRALCRDAAACHVAAFPVQRPAQHGWMPALSFARARSRRSSSSAARPSDASSRSTGLRISDVQLTGTALAVGLDTAPTGRSLTHEDYTRM